ncbi:cerebellin 18 [Denticeps clupeoides]|uniref:C1q domain-containing protein n=1 Tax=Denticeps clupeoides TaxID=299321 RepID=A0AAY4CAH3_9TELE|nr:cerebellin-3-like [Denticeps clupeoides]
MKIVAVATICLLGALNLFSDVEAGTSIDLLKHTALGLTGTLPCGHWDCNCAFNEQPGCCCVADDMFKLEGSTFWRLMGLWNDLSNLNSQITELTGFSGIAFNARMIPMGGCIGPFTSNVSISYGNITLNQGSGYNPSLGIFTAPRAGIYSFSYSVYSNVGAADNRLYFKVQLMKNGVEVASSWEDNREDSEDGSTQTVLLTLSFGSQVYVELVSGRQLCSDAYGQNSFSGYLVYPLSG